MSGMTTGNTNLLIRDEIWSSELKEILRDEMMAQKYVRMLEGFPDGDLFTIPSIGQAQVDDYEEDTDVQYRPLDTGEFQFSIDKYLSSATYITKKAKQDAFYMSQLVSRFVPEMERAIMTHFETTTLATPEVGVSANSNEVIDSVEHRWAAGGTGAVINVEDFARARYALKKSNVPDRNLVAIVYCSNYLKDVTDGALPTAADAGVDFGTVNGKANLFFSADQTASPFVGAWRQQPDVDYEYNKNKQRDEYVTTARYGVKLYRPENMVRVVSKTNV